jgi:hypothetical protein
MREVSRHRDLAVLGLEKSILDGAGIACFIRSSDAWPIGNCLAAVGSLLLFAAALLRGLPRLAVLEVFAPTLCILDSARHEEAVALLLAHRQTLASEHADWVCTHCQETVPGNLDACWNCSKPDLTR